MEIMIDHSDKVSNVAAIALRVSCKRRASKDISHSHSSCVFLLLLCFLCFHCYCIDVFMMCVLSHLNKYYVLTSSSKIIRTALQFAVVTSHDVVFATSCYSLYDWHWRYCAFEVKSCGFINVAFVFSWQFFALPKHAGSHREMCTVAYIVSTVYSPAIMYVSDSWCTT